ncbi:sugar MFS transporter [Micromonospora sp. LOL_025]|uniref:MFS transporter n=1 Tax=Micromonospora sp. LOL_025 TaxID=3345413 RepID=UPI003A86CC66
MTTTNQQPMTDPSCPSRASRIALYVPYVAFTAFGMFWGTWGAALPALRSHAGVSEGELGTALLFVGVGALPAMMFTGPLLDRIGSRPAAPLLAALGVAGLLAATGARDWPSLVAGMLLVGATSGAADVAINTVSGQVEQDTARPVLTRAHGVFSVAVVAASLTAGLVLSTGSEPGNEGAGSTELVGTFVVASLAVLALSAVVWIGTTAAQARPAPFVAPASVPERNNRPSAHKAVSHQTALIGAGRVTATLALVGLVGALAYATENAHQSWGALFLTDSFTASTQTASLAPATFAAAAALTRLTLAPLSRTHPITLLTVGGLVAAAGSLILATSASVTIALMGLAVAAAGTATLFPTLLSSTLHDATAQQRGQATSTISTIAYLGFLLGPAYVGLLADHIGLRGAVVGVAALAVLFALTAAPASRRMAIGTTTRP